MASAYLNNVLKLVHVLTFSICNAPDYVDILYQSKLIMKDLYILITLSKPNHLNLLF